MYGILWTKPGQESILTLAGNDYGTCEVYLESDYKFSRLFREGYRPEIVSCYRENGRWTC